MIVLTAEERKAALLVAGLLALGALSDAWAGCAHRPSLRDPVAARALAPAPESARGGPATGGPGTDAPAGASGPRAPLDLNRATEQELDALPGVGPVLARRIVDHRRRFGPFRDPRDLMSVQGIGPKLSGRLAPYVRAAGATVKP